VKALHLRTKVIPGFVRGEIKRGATHWIANDLPHVLQDSSVPQEPGRQRNQAIRHASKTYLKDVFHRSFGETKKFYREVGGDPKDLKKIGQEAIAQRVKRIVNSAKKLDQGLPETQQKDRKKPWWGPPLRLEDHAYLPEGAGSAQNEGFERLGASDGRSDARRAAGRLTVSDTTTLKQYRQALLQESKVIRQEDRSRPGSGPPVNMKGPYLKGYSEGFQAGVAQAVKKFKRETRSAGP